MVINRDRLSFGDKNIVIGQPRMECSLPLGDKDKKADKFLSDHLD